ncbi:MAG: type III polyketide synthase [Spirochaetales bacterium]|nr:hypothetical protein [Leptospiraceae bacterium]MCP5480968.1 type III polyketide synthase [Spirochaetales bacterium]MCP5485348.1 type III polyketide synthase [Spirochaetales bacterium]
MSAIAATATALPPHYYSQDQLIAAFRELWSKRHYNVERIEQFHRNVLVGGRHLALSLDEYAGLRGFQDSNDAWIRVALELGETTLKTLFERSGVEPGDISYFVSTTVTGLAVPSIEARLMNRFDFASGVKRVPLFGLGCLAGAAGIARVADYLVGHPKEVGILLAVELCSLTLQREDLSVANIVSSGLFGDGAAAVLITGSEYSGPARKNQPRILDSRSVFYPGTERVMGWDIVDTGFKIVLDSTVGDFARKNLRPHVVDFLQTHGLTMQDINVWIAHPGGPKVIEGMVEGLGLAPDALRLSISSLQEVGNLSSASVLFVLEETLRQQEYAPGTYAMMLAMGPAFSAELILLQF